MTIDQEVDDFLAHYGVLGMKWGVRKDRRAQNRAERRERFKSGTATKRDKLIRDLDFDRSSAERKSDSSKDPTMLEDSAIRLATAGAAFVVSRKAGMQVPMSAIMAGTAALGVQALRDSRRGINREKVNRELREKRLRG